MMWNQYRFELSQSRIDERLNPIRDWIERVKNVEERRARGEGEIFSQTFYASHSYEKP